MHQYPCFAGAGTGEHQHVRLLSVVYHDAALNGVSQAFDNGSPRFRRGLPRNFSLSVRQPVAQKIISVQHEIVHCQTQGVSHRPKPPLRELRHNMDLQNLFAVVEFERCEIRLGETSAFRIQVDGHRRSKHRQTAIELDNLLLVKP